MTKTLFLGNHYQMKNGIGVLRGLKRFSFDITATGKVAPEVQREIRDLGIRFEPLRTRLSASQRLRILAHFLPVRGYWLMRRQHSDPDAKHRIDQLIKKELLVAYRAIEQALHVLDRVRPDILVTMADSDTFNASFVLAAQSKNIPTLAIQHGAMVGYEDLPFSTADYYGVWGPIVRQEMIRHGYPAKKIFIIGCSWFSRYNQRRFKNEIEKKSQVFRKNFPQKHLVFFSPNPSGGPNALHVLHPREEFAACLNILSKIPSLHVILGMHPGEKKENYLSLLSKTPVSFSLDEGIDLDLVLKASDAAILHNTTVGLQAMMLDTPLVYVMINAAKNLLPYATKGPAFAADSTKSLSEAVLKILGGTYDKVRYQDRQRWFLRQYCCWPDNNSGRLAEALQDILSHNTINSDYPEE